MGLRARRAAGLGADRADRRRRPRHARGAAEFGGCAAGGVIGGATSCPTWPHLLGLTAQPIGARFGWGCTETPGNGLAIDGNEIGLCANAFALDPRIPVSTLPWNE